MINLKAMTTRELQDLKAETEGAIQSLERQQPPWAFRQEIADNVGFRGRIDHELSVRAARTIARGNRMTPFTREG
jgi:hypothetical protein